MTGTPPIAAAKQHAAFFRQSGWLMIATIGGGALTWAVHFLNRKIPDEEYSNFVMLLMVTACLPTMPLQMMFAQQTVRGLATNRERQLAGIIRSAWRSLFLVWLVAAVVIFIFQKPILHRWQLNSPAALWITLVTVLFSLWMPMGSGLLQGRQNFFWLGWSIILNSACRIGVAAVLVLALGFGADGMILGALIGTGLSVGISFWLTRDIWTLPREPFDMRGLWRQTTPLIFSFGVCQFMFTSDNIFASAYFTKHEMAPYSMAGTLSRALLWLVLPLAAVMFPKLVHSNVKSEKTNLGGIVLLGTAVLAVCAVAGLWLVGPWVVRLVGKPENAEATLRLLPWYAGAMVPLALANVLVNDLMAKARFRVVPFLVVVAVAYGFTLPYLLNHVSQTLLTVLQTLGAFNLLLFVVCACAAFGGSKAETRNATPGT